MSAADLMARIDAARGGHRRAAGMLSEARSTGEDDFDWDDGRNVGELIGGLVGGATGTSLGARVGAALGGPIGAVVGAVLEVGGEIREEVEDFVEGVDWDDGRDVGELIGEFLGGAVGTLLGARGGAALGGLIGAIAGPYGAVAGAFLGGTAGGLAGGLAGEEVGSAVGGEIGEEIEDFVEGRGFGTGDEESERGIPAPRTGDPVPVRGDRVPELPTSHYGLPRHNGSSSPEAEAYDARVTGNTTGLAVYLDNPDGSGVTNRDNPIPRIRDTEFDWVEYGSNDQITLIDAKYHSPDARHSQRTVIRTLQRALDQADRQIAAMQYADMDNIRIEWRVSDPEFAALYSELFENEGIDIDVVPVP